MGLIPLVALYSSVLAQEGSGGGGGMSNTGPPMRDELQVLYAVNSLSRDISRFRVLNQPLSEIRSSLPVGDEPVAVVVDPSSRYVLVANEGSEDVTVFRIDDRFSRLIPVGSTDTEQRPSALVFDPEGRFVYVANRGSDSISIFEQERSSGGLLPRGRVVAQDGPNVLAIDPTGDFLIVGSLSSGTLTVFRRHSNGALNRVWRGVSSESATAPNEAPGPSSLAFDASGEFLAVVNRSFNELAVFRLERSGRLTLATSIRPPGEELRFRAVAAHPDEDLLYVAASGSPGSPVVLRYRLEGGVPQLEAGGITGVDSPRDPAAIQVVVAESSSGAERTFVLMVDQLNGVLSVFGELEGGAHLCFTSLRANLPCEFGAFIYTSGSPESLAYDRRGRVYVAGRDSGTLSIVSLNVDTGVPAPVGGEQTAEPGAIVLSPSEDFLFAVTGNVSTPGTPPRLEVFEVDEAGTIFRVTAVPDVGAGPYSLAVDPGGEHLVLASAGSGTLRTFEIASLLGDFPADPKVFQGLTDPGEVEFSPGGRFVVVAEADGLSVLELGSDGALTRAAGSVKDIRPALLEIGPPASGGPLVVAASTGTLSFFRLTARGDLEPVTIQETSGNFLEFQRNLRSMAISPLGDRLLAATFQRVGELTVLGLSEGEDGLAVAEIEQVSLGFSPNAVALSVVEGNELVFVSGGFADTLSVHFLDGSGQLTFLQRLTTVGSPFFVATSQRGGSLVFTLNTIFGIGFTTGRIQVFRITPGDAGLFRSTGSPSGGAGTSGLALGPAGEHLFVINQQSASLAALDIEDGSYLGLVPSDGTPLAVATTERHVLVTASTSTTDVSLNVFEVDKLPLAPDRVPLGFLRSIPISVAASEDGRFAFVADFFNGLIVVNLEELSVEATIRTSRGMTAVIVTGRFVVAAFRNGVVDVFELFLGSSGEFERLDLVDQLRGVGSRLRSAAVDPAGRLVLVSDEVGRIVFLEVDETGALSLAQRLEGFARPFGVTFSPDGRLALVTVSRDEVAVLEIDRSLDGRFMEARDEGQRVPVGDEPVSVVAVERNGLLSAFVANLGSSDVSVLRFDPQFGFVSRSASRGLPSSIAVDSSARFAFVTELVSDQLRVFRIEPVTGQLLSVSSAPTGRAPAAVALDRSGSHAYVANSGSDSVSVFSIDPLEGSLKLVTEVAAGQNPVAVLVHPEGGFVMTADFVSGSVTVFRRNPDTGDLSDPQSLMAGPGPIDLAASSDGTFLYVAGLPAPDGEEASGTIAQFRLVGETFAPLGRVPGELVPRAPTAIVAAESLVFIADGASNEIVALEAGSDGRLRESQLAGASVDGGPQDLVLGPRDEFLYVSGHSTDRVEVFRVDEAVGLLPLDSAATGLGPRGLALGTVRPRSQTCARALEIPFGRVAAEPLRLILDTSRNRLQTEDGLDACMPAVPVPIGKTAWFSVLAEGDGVLSVNSAGSNFDTVLAVHAGDCTSLSCEGFSDDSPSALTSTLRIPVSRGTTYFVQAGGFAGTGGLLVLEFGFEPLR